MKKKYLLPLLLCVLLFTAFTYDPKPDIKQATITTISREIDGVGDKTATRIKNYCVTNNIKSVKDLKPGQIDRVGVKTIEKLSKKFK